MPAFATVPATMLRLALLIDEHVALRPIFSTTVLTSGCAVLQSRTAKAAFFPPRHRNTRVVGLCV